MPKKETAQDKQVAKAIEALTAQRDKLHSLFNEYYSAYDAAFDQYSAYAAISRWLERTCKLIAQTIGQSEASKFHVAANNAPRGRGGWRWKELCEYFDNQLVVLVQDVVENPDDEEFDAINGAQQVASGESNTQISCDFFLSYSTLDTDEAREIHKGLGRANRTCFMSEKSIQPGDVFEERIREALRTCSEVWILVSPNSNRSEWVQREVSAAWALEKKVVPILLRCSPNELPSVMKGFQAIDYHKISDYIKRLS